MKVLLATDGSPQSETAINTAARLLRKDRAQFDLFCVAPEFIPPGARREKNSHKRTRMIEAYREKIRAEMHVKLLQTQGRLSTRGIEAGIQLEIGSPARVITRKSGNYNITVVGAHDRYTRSAPGLGPVANRVVAAASNAVLIGRELTSDSSWRVLIAVDGSLASRQAMGALITYFQSQFADITLMHVTETPWVHLGLGREWFDSAEGVLDRSEGEAGTAFEEELGHEAGSVIEEARSYLEGHGLSAGTLVAEGNPALEILSEAERGEYDLIVLGATGESDLKHSMLGSVSTRVAQDAACSVLVVKFNE